MQLLWCTGAGLMILVLLSALPSTWTRIGPRMFLVDPAANQELELAVLRNNFCLSICFLPWARKCQAAALQLKFYQKEVGPVLSVLQAHPCLHFMLPSPCETTQQPANWQLQVQSSWWLLKGGKKVENNPHLTTPTRHVMVGMARSRVVFHCLYTWRNDSMWLTLQMVWNHQLQSNQWICTVKGFLRKFVWFRLGNYTEGMSIDFFFAICNRVWLNVSSSPKHSYRIKLLFLWQGFGECIR